MAKKDSSVQPGDTLDFHEALKRAAELCSRQEQNTGHIREKLTEWKVSESDAGRIIEKLSAEKFLDDRRYATAFVRDKFRFNRWGRVKITHMLRAKGIADETIEEALSVIDEEQYTEACREVLRGKSATLKEKNRWTRKAKLHRFATGRGFESDLVYRLLDR